MDVSRVCRSTIVVRVEVMSSVQEQGKSKSHSMRVHYFELFFSDETVVGVFDTKDEGVEDFRTCGLHHILKVVLKSSNRE